jgi:hypothetical protein
MIRPAAFGFNEETADSNAFQHRPGSGGEDGGSAAIRASALVEFDDLVRVLDGAGVEAVVFEDTAEPAKPDAVFPNNWITFHPDGTVVLYPMQARVRRLERRPDVIFELETRHGFRVRRVIDLSAHEAENRFLEGSGSLVFDDDARCVYAGLSPRTDPDLARNLAELLSYDLELFQPIDDDGRPVYHTNVVLTIGARICVVADGTIRDPARRGRVLDRLGATGRDIVCISTAQMERFAGNLIALTGANRQSRMLMSATARDALGAGALERIGRHSEPLVASVPTIERVGGGSVRCMVADVRLPRAARSDD